MAEGLAFARGVVIGSVHRFGYGYKFSERRRHRSWPDDLKREIVAASLGPGSSVSLVARRYDVNANQVFAWRKRYRAGSTEPAALQLLPVTVTSDRPIATASARANELIEIELAGGVRVRVDGDVSLAALRRVVAALRG